MASEAGTQEQAPSVSVRVRVLSTYCMPRVVGRQTGDYSCNFLSSFAVQDSSTYLQCGHHWGTRAPLTEELIEVSSTGVREDGGELGGEQTLRPEWAGSRGSEGGACL